MLSLGAFTEGEGISRLALERKMVFNAKMERVTTGRMKVLLGMFFYMRTGRLLELDSIRERNDFKGIKTVSGPGGHLSEDEGGYNTSGAYEHELVDMVSHGRLEDIGGFFGKREHVNFGCLSSESLRHQKNLGIVTVTLVSRAAVSGGMNEEYAYHLSDDFIQELEGAEDAGTLDDITGKMIIKYTKEVRRLRQKLLSAPVRDAEGYISQNYSSKLTVSSVAKEMGYSPNYLGNIFKKETGMSMPDFILEKRLEQAGFLLRSTNMSVTEISTQTGFSTAAHLCMRFKERYGSTPAAYRAGNNKRER